MSPFICPTSAFARASNQRKTATYLMDTTRIQPESRPILEQITYEKPSASASAATCTTYPRLARLLAVDQLTFHANAFPSYDWAAQRKGHIPG